MRDVAPSLRALIATDQPFALATVVGTSGSTPRSVGSVMAVSVSGAVVGSLSGGCLEGAVYDVALGVLSSGVPAQETFGVSDEDAFSIGLTCGGVLEVLVAVPDRPLLGRVLDLVDADEPVALVTVCGGPVLHGAQLAVTSSWFEGSLGSAGLDVAAAAEARAMLASGVTGVRHIGAQGECGADEVTVLVQAMTPPPRLLVFGATDFSAALARIACFLGYHVVICDPRATFTTTARFPEAHEVVCAWPDAWFAAEVAAGRVDERTVVALLTHDDRYDVAVLNAALGSRAGYVGAMGSRRTADARMRRLREAGVDDHTLARLHSPIGVDIGGRTPEETAVAIAAEMVLARWGGTGQPLRTLGGDIHRASATQLVT